MLNHCHCCFFLKLKKNLLKTYKYGFVRFAYFIFIKPPPLQYNFPIFILIYLQKKKKFQGSYSVPTR